MTKGYHDLSHHGHKEENIKQLSLIDQVHLRSWGRFVEKLKSTKEADGRTMLDSTIPMLGSGLGDGARHNNENLPLIMAGGGWQQETQRAHLLAHRGSGGEGGGSVRFGRIFLKTRT